MPLILRFILLSMMLFGTWQAQANDAIAPAKPGEQRSTVVIDSRPEHAEILLDGKFVGTTPLSFSLTPGEHRVELTRIGYGSWARELTVMPSAPAKLVAILVPNEMAGDPCSKKP